MESRRTRGRHAQDLKRKGDYICAEQKSQNDDRSFPLKLRKGFDSEVDARTSDNSAGSCRINFSETDKQASRRAGSSFDIKP